MKLSLLLSFLYWEVFIVLVLLNQDKRPTHVRSIAQRYDKILNSTAFVCGKTWWCLKKLTWRESFQYMLCKMKASFLWHIMRKKQRALLYVSYVLMSTWACLCRETKKNVFVNSNGQRRACSDIAMARKRTFRGTRKEQFPKGILFYYKALCKAT